MLLTKISKGGTIPVKELDSITFLTMDNIRENFRRDTLFYVIQPHSKHLRFVCNYFQVRDRLIKGWNKITMFQCGQLVTFNLNSNGESDDEWSEWYKDAKAIIREMMLRKELYCERII